MYEREEVGMERLAMPTTTYFVRWCVEQDYSFQVRMLVWPRMFSVLLSTFALLAFFFSLFFWPHDLLPLPA